MADIKPFQAIRPKKGLEDRIAALPYDVYNREEAKAEVEKEPLSFLRIDRAEVNFDESVDTYDDRVYQKAHDLLWEQIENGTFIQEEKPCYYLYRQIMNGRAQTGIAACASIEDYENQVIKKHENTREDKELDRIRHVDSCDAQTGPIFLAYRRNERIEAVSKEILCKPPVYDFTSKDEVTHQVWLIEEEEKISEIKRAFSEIESIYIADGHHRCASAVKVGLKRRQEMGSYSEKKEYEYFLSVLFPDEELKILDYNRVVTDLNGLAVETFLEKISKDFLLTPQAEPYRPKKKGCFGMYLNNQWYELCYQKEYSKDPVESLDVSVLQKEVLEPLLGISNPKTDKRIDFVGGIRGLGELERRVHKDMKVAFSLYPTSIQELFQVADHDLLMPPKSTWFEPKLRSGIFIHSIK